MNLLSHNVLPPVHWTIFCKHEQHKTKFRPEQAYHVFAIMPTQHEYYEAEGEFINAI
jgi:hypothetical protein